MTIAACPGDLTYQAGIWAKVRRDKIQILLKTSSNGMISFYKRGWGNNIFSVQAVYQDGLKKGTYDYPPALLKHSTVIISLLSIILFN
jgi:hypothetical protein